jgi:predicted DNA-binding transcriptional regulator AlpA
MSTPIITIAPLAVDRETAAAICGVGASVFQAQVQQGGLPRARKINGRAVWLVSDLHAALQALPVADHLPPPAKKAA